MVRGAQGAVFKISPNKCVKIYAKQEYLVKTVDVLKIAQESSTISLGQNYIIMEYLEGATLFQYLGMEVSYPKN